MMCDLFISEGQRIIVIALSNLRDVIELPIDDILDINGWDLQKTLRLLYKSNPTLFEWFSSPIVYQETEFADKLRDLMMHYFSSKKTLYHYISMAEKNYRGYLKGELVRAKKYFYVLRPVLACRWIFLTRYASAYVVFGVDKRGTAGRINQCSESIAGIKDELIRSKID
ncbi:MAG: nucleotidyltransferase domain-containing protein [Lachnospiraceae bacterium]